MDGAGVAAFLHSSYNITADAKMLLFFLHPGLETVAVAGGLGLASLVWRGAPCRWLCPYGALLGLLALAGPLALARDSERCTGCGRCRRACPLDIPVASGRRPLECNGCAACVLACPTAAGAARLTLAGRTVPWWLPAAGALAVFVLAFAAARACGVWETTLPLSMMPPGPPRWRRRRRDAVRKNIAGDGPLPWCEESGGSIAPAAGGIFPLPAA